MMNNRLNGRQYSNLLTELEELENEIKINYKKLDYTINEVLAYTDAVNEMRKIIHKYKPCERKGRVRNSKTYALYKGDKLLMYGTIDDIAKARGIKRKSVLTRLTKSYNSRMNGNNHLVLVELEDEY